MGKNEVVGEGKTKRRDAQIPGGNLEFRIARNLKKRYDLSSDWSFAVEQIFKLMNDVRWAAEKVNWKKKQEVLELAFDLVQCSGALFCGASDQTQGLR